MEEAQISTIQYYNCFWMEIIFAVSWIINVEGFYFKMFKIQQYLDTWLQIFLLSQIRFSSFVRHWLFKQVLEQDGQKSRTLVSAFLLTSTFIIMYYHAWLNSYSALQYHLWDRHIRCQSLCCLGKQFSKNIFIKAIETFCYCYH